MLLSALVARPLPTANITVAPLFRAVERFQPTLLVDEADTFLPDNDELRGVLNSGWLRASAVAVRSVGDEHEPRLFSTWSPKAVAMIGTLPGTLADRAVEVRMARQTAEEESAIEKLRGDRLHEFEPLRRRCGRWAQDGLETLREADPVVPAELSNRRADNWRPLLAIADLVGGKWPHTLREAVRLLSPGKAQDDQSLRVRLLADIRAAFEALGSERVPSEALVAALVGMEEGPWAECNRGRPLTPVALARLLKPFAVFPRTMRFAEKPQKGYGREAFLDAWARYLPAEPLQPLQAAVHAAETETPDPLQSLNVTTAKSVGSPVFSRLVTHVTAQSSHGAEAKNVTRPGHESHDSDRLVEWEI